MLAPVWARCLELFFHFHVVLVKISQIIDRRSPLRFVPPLSVKSWIRHQRRIYVEEFRTRAPPRPIFFNFAQFLGNFGKIVCWCPSPLSEGYRPPPRGKPGSATVECSDTCLQKCNDVKFFILTRMHSNRMRTVRCSSRLLGGGGCLPRVCLLGVCLGVCLVCPRGVSGRRPLVDRVLYTRF